MAAPLRRALLALGPARSRLPVPVPAPARPYRADPLRRRPGPAPTDPDDLRAAARRFGRLGDASGVEVWRLWPSPEQLREAEAEEREWDPPLRDADFGGRSHRVPSHRVPREELVSRSLAAMPARVAAWRREREALRERARADAERRRRLLAEAGLGGLPRSGTPGRASARAQELLDEMERQKRREEKRRRRQEREEAARSALAAAEAAAAARPLPGAAPEGEEKPPNPTEKT
uniref:Large ribosomal subunit protein mL64 n=1 Tax=Catharus ustulatus TaxID=91951 RepID=A0A8C3UIF8_CATUS